MTSLNTGCVKAADFGEVQMKTFDSPMDMHKQLLMYVKHVWPPTPLKLLPG